MPDTAMNALLSMEQRGHPWRGTTYARTDWADGLDVPTLAERPDAEILFWVGCTAALEQRSQSVARSMASVLKRAGVDFAILGDEETCTGDPARRMGNEYLYQILAQQNIETMNTYNVKKVVTICPHCFNTIKNEYPSPRRRLRCRPLHRVRQRPNPRRPHPAHRAGRHDHRIPRLLLLGTPQRHLRRSQGDRQLYPRGQARGDETLPRARLLLRSGRRAHVDRGIERPTYQPRPHPAVPRNRRANRRRVMSVLSADVRRGYRLRRKRKRARRPRDLLEVLDESLSTQ